MMDSLGSMIALVIFVVLITKLGYMGVWVLVASSLVLFLLYFYVLAALELVKLLLRPITKYNAKMRNVIPQRVKDRFFRIFETFVVVVIFSSPILIPAILAVFFS